MSGMAWLFIEQAAGLHLLPAGAGKAPNRKKQGSWTCSATIVAASVTVNSEFLHGWTPRVDEKCSGPFQIASRLTNLACQARGTLKLSLVRFILQSTCDWSIHSLRGIFGVQPWFSFSWRALQMKNRNLSVSDLVRIGADTLNLAFGLWIFARDLLELSVKSSKESTETIN
jgi:hypothetical protein